MSLCEFLPMDKAIDETAVKFGTEIFKDLMSFTPMPFERAYWNMLFTKLTIKAPALRTSLFRLVDVLPTLKSDSLLLSHIQEYLSKPIEQIHPGLHWLLKIAVGRHMGGLTSALVRFSVSEMAKVFIVGESPELAVPHLKRILRRGQSFTVDLLGEYSVSEHEALCYLERYRDVVQILDKELVRSTSGPGDTSSLCISVKLSALYSQIDPLNHDKSVLVLSKRLAEIARTVRTARGTLYVDAEDTKYNAIVYDTFMKVFGSEEFRDMPFPGIVVQAYSRSAKSLIDVLLNFAATRGNPIAIRLVKGAYWDIEKVVAAQNNWESPLFSEKVESDASFEAISRLLLENTKLCRPAFASHNIRSLSYACAYAKHRDISPDTFEIQVLYGMADGIAQAFSRRGYQTRFYAPIGRLIPGMGYLVRRLLENSSNESFLRHTFFEPTAVKDLLRSPGHEQTTTPSPVHAQELKLQCNY